MYPGTCTVRVRSVVAVRYMYMYVQISSFLTSPIQNRLNSEYRRSLLWQFMTSAHNFGQIFFRTRQKLSELIRNRQKLSERIRNLQTVCFVLNYEQISPNTYPYFLMKQNETESDEKFSPALVSSDKWALAEKSCQKCCLTVSETLWHWRWIFQNYSALVRTKWKSGWSLARWALYVTCIYLKIAVHVHVNMLINKPNVKSGE